MTDWAAPTARARRPWADWTWKWAPGLPALKKTCPTTISSWPIRFWWAIRTNDIPLSVLDDKVRRNLRPMFATHVFDPVRLPGALNTPTNHAIAQRIAEESMVLLKNDNQALPLNAANIASVAVIGENAVRTNAAGFFGAGVKTMHEITPLDGILQRAGSRMNVTYSVGYSKSVTNSAAISNLVERAVAAARQADVAIVVAASITPAIWMTKAGTGRTLVCLTARTN